MHDRVVIDMDYTCGAIQLIVDYSNSFPIFYFSLIALAFLVFASIYLYLQT